MGFYGVVQGFEIERAVQGYALTFIGFFVINASLGVPGLRVWGGFGSSLINGLLGRIYGFGRIFRDEECPRAWRV